MGDTRVKVIGLEVRAVLYSTFEPVSVAKSFERNRDVITE